MRPNNCKFKVKSVCSNRKVKYVYNINYIDIIIRITYMASYIKRQRIFLLFNNI